MSIEAVGAGSYDRMDTWPGRNDHPHMAMHDAARMMWSHTDLKPGNIDTAHLCDGFSRLTMLWLEGPGICGDGECGAFIEGGQRIALDGELPLNTNGGQLPEGRVHGFGHLHEAMLQLRDQTGARPVKDVRVSVIGNGSGRHAGGRMRGAALDIDNIEEHDVTRPLEGIKVVEVSMWAFVPSAGAILADLGADVTKIEPPSGDPIRGLNTGGLSPGAGGFNFMWEIFNRGKRSITLDLKLEGALEVLHKLLVDADVFLTSLLPPARRAMNIDVEEITKRYPNLIYAAGSGQGAHGPDAEKGGYDSISFWARSGVASAVTPDSHPYPLSMPGGAFGDGLSGAIFAGGISAAIAQRALTGKASVVDSSLLGTGMWAMQPGIVASNLFGIAEMPKPGRAVLPNPLVNNYRTSDDRFVALCMLQGQRYWPDFCRAIGHDELVGDPRFETDAQRVANIAECIAVLDSIFVTKSLAEWKAMLATQDGQWDVVQKVGELASDPAATANHFIQDVDYGDGRSIKMVSAPFQFDRQALSAHPAPELGADSDAVLAGLGYNEDEIIDLKVAGIVY